MKMNDDLKKYIIWREYIEAHPELEDQYEQYKAAREEDKRYEKGFWLGRFEERKRIVNELIGLEWSLEKIKETLGFNPEKYL